MNEDKQSIVPKWLEELQQKSWEPEILLSGIVLYGMFKVPDLLDAFLKFFELNIFGNSQDIDNLVALFKMGIYWLISGLILHLICRGIWIGMVGLSYTFPNGIRNDAVHYSGKFGDKVSKIPSYEQIVIRLEKISSALFSISFMLFMSLIGGYLFFLILVIVPFTTAYLYFDMGFEGPVFDAFQIYVFTIVIIGLIGLLDFVTLGYFRRFKWVAKIYWPLYRVISALTLSRFYRPIYYGLVTNFNKWVLFVFLLIFAFGSIFGTGSMVNTTYPGENYSKLTLWSTGRGYSAFSGYYDDQNEELASVWAQIQSDVVTGDVLKLFLVANISREDEALEYTNLDSLKEAYPDTARAALELHVIKEYYKVKIDQKPIETEWLYHYKYATKQRGYLTFINISELNEGLHKVSVSGPEEDASSLAIIPFYRDLAIKPSTAKPRGEKDDESPDFQPKPFGIRD